VKGADGFSGKERLSADDHRGDRQGGIGPGVGLSFLQARHPGMRAEWFDLPGLNSPARHDSLMSGPEGRKERFDSPWNTSRYRKGLRPCDVCCRRAWPGRKMAVRESHGARAAGSISGLFSTHYTVTSPSVCQHISKDRTLLREKRKYVLTDRFGSAILIGGSAGNLSGQRENTPFCHIQMADLSGWGRHCRAMALGCSRLASFPRPFQRINFSTSTLTWHAGAVASGSAEQPAR
jgi:hypothetical protein